MLLKTTRKPTTVVSSAPQNKALQNIPQHLLSKERPALAPLVTIDPDARSGVWDLMRDGVTQSFLGSWLLCPEKARLGAVEGLTPIRTGNALGFGSLVHDTLEKIYLALSTHPTKVSDPGSLARVTLDYTLREKEKKDRLALVEKGMSGPEETQQLEENYGIAEGILPGYLKKWTEDFEEVEWIALEKTFKVVIRVVVGVEEFFITVRGKWDGVYRSRKTGKLWLFETKTKGRISEESIAQKLSFDLQAALYLWAVWVTYGEVPGGVVYNILRNPNLRRGKTETLQAFIARVKKDTEDRPDHYYLRFMSSVVKQDIEKFENELKSQLAQLIRWTRGEFHWKNSSACSSFGVDCAFLSTCASGDRSRFKKKETAFPELEESTNEDE